MHNVTKSSAGAGFGHVSTWDVLMWPKSLQVPNFGTLRTPARNENPATTVTPASQGWSSWSDALGRGGPMWILAGVIGDRVNCEAWDPPDRPAATT